MLVKLHLKKLLCWSCDEWHSISQPVYINSKGIVYHPSENEFISLSGEYIISPQAVYHQFRRNCISSTRSVASPQLVTFKLDTMRNERIREFRLGEYLHACFHRLRGRCEPDSRDGLWQKQSGVNR